MENSIAIETRDIKIGGRQEEQEEGYKVRK